MSEMTNNNQIGMYLHCSKCIAELDEGQQGTEDESPSSYSQLGIGWTELGLQIWCERHNCNVLNIDFEGAKHPSDDTIHSKPKLELV